MTNRTIPNRFLFDLPYMIRLAQGNDPWIARRYSEEAAWNLLKYLRDEKKEADPTAIQFLHDSYRKFTERQQQKLWRAIHAKRGRPRREPDHENVAFGKNEIEFQMIVAGLCHLTGSQLRWLSKIITSRMGRPTSPATGQEQRNKNGARAHQLIEERRKARIGQVTRLRGDGPYESVMEDAQSLFRCSQRTLERAYVEFKKRRKDRIVDGNGSYIDVQPLDDEYRENEAP